MAKPIALLLFSLALPLVGACGDSADSETAPSSGPAYVVGSLVSGPDGSTAYVNVIASLDAQTLDYASAYEFPGQADVWSWNGKLYVSDGESPVVRRYAVAADRTLVEEGELSFAAYGVASTAFWNAIWVSADKAYMANGQGVYVIWNPSTMAITGTMPYPTFDEIPDRLLRPASTDRGVVVSGNRLYHPYYWTDAGWTNYEPASKIAIYDTDADRLISVVDAACPGLDVATEDDSGNIYFSNWTGNVGLALVAGQAAPCGVKLDTATDTVDTAWTAPWPTIADGREASALRYSGDGHALLSVFHDESVTFDASSDPFAVIGTANWEIWRMDLATREAAPVDGIALNSGATYMQRIGDLSYVLVPSAGYASSSVYAVDGGSAALRFDTRGWGLRLFQIR